MTQKNTKTQSKPAPFKLSRMMKLLKDMDCLMPPLSDDDKKNLAELGGYLKQYYAQKDPVHVVEYKDLKGKPVKTFNVLEVYTFICREERKDGPVFWVRTGDGKRDFAICTDGKSVMEYPPEILEGDDNYWILREYNDNGSYNEIRREPDKMIFSCYDKTG